MATDKALGERPGVGWPKITLVTPVLNAASYIEQTIRSVVYQGYPNLEYIIVDGGSNDGTIEIIRRYEEYLTWWISEPDQGMYDALNKGFARSSGEIMGWVSGTDLLHVGSLLVPASVFRKFPQVEWITGIPTFFNTYGVASKVGKLRRWSRLRFLAGSNQFLELGFSGIQQESTLWRRSLWERSGGCVDASRRDGSDFELWTRFFRHARLYSVNALIGGYRAHEDASGLQWKDDTRLARERVIEAELNLIRLGKAVRVFRRINRVIEGIPKFRVLWWHLVLKILYQFPGPDFPPVIRERDGSGWVMVR